MFASAELVQMLSDHKKEDRFTVLLEDGITGVEAHVIKTLEDRMKGVKALQASRRVCS